MPTQTELAKHLIDHMEIAGDDSPTVLDLLDDLACAGLKLVPDNEGTASLEYLAHLVPQIKSQYTPEQIAIMQEHGVTVTEIDDLIYWEEIARDAIASYPAALAAAAETGPIANDVFAARMGRPLDDGELERDTEKLEDWLFDIRVDGALLKLIEDRRMSVRWDPEIEDWRVVART